MRPFRTAYAALQKANMEIGIAFVDQISHTVPVENSIRIKTRSVMGTEIPLVEYDKKKPAILLPTPTTAPSCPWTRPKPPSSV